MKYILIALALAGCTQLPATNDECVSPEALELIRDQRDARTLGEAVCVCEELLLGRSTFSTDEIFGIRCCIREIKRLAAEKEK